MGTKVLGTGIYLGGDPSNRNESGEVRLWGRKATKGCVIEVAALSYGVTPLRHLRRVQSATKTVSSNSGKLGHLSGLHWVRVFLEVLSRLYFCALKALVGESLEAEKLREVRWLLVKMLLVSMGQLWLTSEVGPGNLLQTILNVCFKRLTVDCWILQSECLLESSLRVCWGAYLNRVDCGKKRDWRKCSR